jgi:hypothetical protein
LDESCTSNPKSQIGLPEPGAVLMEAAMIHPIEYAGDHAVAVKGKFEIGRILHLKFEISNWTA